MAGRYSLSSLLCLMAATVGAAFAPAPVYRAPKPKGRDVSSLMQGIWEVQHPNNVVFIRRGIAAKIAPQRIRIEGDCWEYLASDDGFVERLSVKNRIVLDYRANPGTLDLVQTGLRGEETTMKGIVELDGDTLKFCYVSAQEKNAERPKRFAVGSPSGPIRPNDPRMMTLKRVK